MRKKLLSILALTILLATILAGCGQASSTPPTLTILSITEGHVFVMKAGADDWTGATVEMSLEVGDTIKTGDDSGAEITFFDGSTIELEAGTQIEITSLDSSADTGATTITLMQTIGTTISRVTKLLDPASTYAIETPSGVAAVRGSTLIVRIVFDDPNYEDGTVLITCVEGDIWVIWNGVELAIPEGYTCVIRPDGLLELIPPNEPPQTGGDDDTDEDTTNGQSDDGQPESPTGDSLNHPPVAVLDTAVTEVNTSITINVLNNDSDVDGDALTVNSVTQGTHGSVTNNGGDVTYAPDSGFTGTDHFTYTISDGNGGTDTATVTVFIIDVSELEYPVTPPTDGEAPPGDGEPSPPDDQNPPTGGGTTATIQITISPGTGAPVFIWDDTTGSWAIDQDTNSEIDGVIPASAHITVAADHHYYVWVYDASEEGVTRYDVGSSHNWTVSPAPAEYGGYQADGSPGPGDNQPLHFVEIETGGT